MDKQSKELDSPLSQMIEDALEEHSWSNKKERIILKFCKKTDHAAAHGLIQLDTPLRSVRMLLVTWKRSQVVPPNSSAPSKQDAWKVT